MAFTHLHVHTEFSLLDGAARIRDLVSRAKELGMESLAITDHGVMFGVVDFYKECMKQGIKPIIGCEVYTAARKMTDKDPDKDKRQGHLVLLAKDNEGYKNLIKIVSLGFTKGFYYKPRIDKDVLRAHSKGIIALSACLAGNIQRSLLNRDYDGAKREALELREIFGEGNFYLEIQDQGLPEEARINPEILRLSQETGIKTVATNDCHYVRQSDAEAHDVLLAIQTATSINDDKRMRFPNDQFYLKSEEEMRSVFSYAPEACDNTQEVADKCDVRFTFGEYHLPEFIPPEGKTNKGYLRELCASGLKERYGHLLPQRFTAEDLDAPIVSTGTGEEVSYNQLKERLDYELSVIENMGYVEYFLIVWDFINYAKSNQIVVGPGRGSAAGSLVAYCLRITDIDPIRYNLIFERFLNPERVSMPDIDIDFCIERRGEVIDYVKRKYGEDNVSQIITFGTLKAKAAIRDVGRALELSYADTDRLAKAVPNDLGMTLDKALEVSPEFKALYESDELMHKVVDMSRALEGMMRHASTHAAGVVISKLPLDEYVPLYMSDRGLATQFNMTTIEELGLLKMDFLGLRNLTVIRDALELIEQDTGKRIDFAKMGYDDPGVYEMIAKGDTDGVFQLESAGMTSFMKSLKPSCFEDVVAGISLYRPGPMDSIPKYIDNKKNPHKIKYVTPELAPILDVTYGCLVYQEQVMQIVRDLAGYSYGRSDLVRRAMSKKKKDVMAEEKQYFIYGKDREDGSIEIKGCVRNGISVEAAEAIFADMETFAQYAFNKSHAAAYAVLAFETGYLKRYYPVEFMAALMSSVMRDPGQTSKYIRNCKDLGIEILPPSVNDSFRKYTVENGKIRFALQAIKNVGENAIDNIVSAREEKGRFTDIFRFINSIDVSVVNKKAVESLIKAGALDCLNENRAAHMAVYEGLMESAQSDARKNIAGQFSLFDMNSEQMNAASTTSELPKVRNFDRMVLLAMEKEYLGIYSSGHPLDDYADDIRRIATVTSADLETAPGEDPESGRQDADFGGAPKDITDGMSVTLAGMITGRKTLITKKNQMMAFVDLEDLYGQVEVVVFPRVYERFQENIAEDRVVVITGRLDFKEGEAPKVLADSVVDISDADAVREKRGEDRYRTERPYADAAPSTPSGIPEEDPEGSEPAEDERDVRVKVRIPEDADEAWMLGELSKLFKANHGPSDVYIYRQNGKTVKTGKGKGVSVSGAFVDALCSLAGGRNVKIEEL